MRFQQSSIVVPRPSLVGETCGSALADSSSEAAHMLVVVASRQGHKRMVFSG